MPESGGPTTQSGIYFQNSLAALYLGRLCDPRPMPYSERIISVRIEAPEYVDDIVATFADNSRLLIQAKEALATSGDAWNKLWSAVRRQLEETRGSQRILISVGRYAPELDCLKEGLERASGLLSAQEWRASLSKQQRAVFNKVSRSLGGTDDSSLFLLAQKCALEFRTLHEIETVGVRDWLPPSNVAAATIYSYLRDLCGGFARHRKTFRAAELLDILNHAHQVVVESVKYSKTDKYLNAVRQTCSYISVPGTPVKGSVDILFLWPDVRPRLVKSTSLRDFEEEDIRFRPASYVDPIDLQEFPRGKVRRAIIDAAAGLGKTTLLRAIANKLSSDAVFVPVIAPLDLLIEFESVDQFLADAINKRYSVAIDWNMLCEHGRAVVLFDGLDELDDFGRLRAIGQVERFTARYPDVALLLTVRDSSTLSVPTGFETLEITRLSSGDVQGFVHKYCTLRPELNANEICHQFYHQPDLTLLSKIPLFLAITLATIRPYERLPERRSEVLERYLSVLFAPERFKEQTRPLAVPDGLREAAEALAHAVLETNSLGLHERSAVQRLQAASLRRSPDEYLRALVQRGLLARDGGRVRFLFQIVQEYLAACWLIAHRIDDLANSFSLIARRPWAQALQFALELHKDAGRVIEAELVRPDDAFHTALRLVARCVVNGTRVNSAVRAEIERRLIQAWPSRSFDVNNSVAYLIDDMFEPPISKELRAALLRDDHLRGSILRRANDPSLTLEVLECLLKEPDIRGLSGEDWQAALEHVASKALPMLLEKARLENGNTIGSSSIASAILHLSVSAIGDMWRDISTDKTLPAIVRLAAMGHSSKPIPSPALGIVDELASSYASVWPHDLASIYFNIAGWQDHLRAKLRKERAPDRWNLHIFLEMLPIEQEHAREFRQLLRELSIDAKVSKAFRFLILRSFLYNNEREIAPLISNLLSEFSEAELARSYWVDIIPHVSEGTVSAAIERTRRSKLKSRGKQIELAHRAADLVFYRPASKTDSFGVRGPYIRSSEPHAAVGTVLKWCRDLLTKSKLTRVHRVILHAAIVTCDGLEGCKALEAALSELLIATPVITSVVWSAICDATFAAEKAGFLFSADVYWKIVRQAQKYPTWSMIDAIAKIEGPRCHAKFLEYYANNVGGDAKSAIFQYFERISAKEGLRVTERDGKLLIETS